MAYFPFFVDVGEKTCLIVGGGRVAYRKAKSVLEFGAEVKMVAPVFCDELKALLEKNDVLQLHTRRFREDDIEDVLFVIAATDDRELNGRIYEICQRKNRLVNVVDEKEQCSFFFPSLVKRGDIVVGISSGGKSPLLSQKIRKKVESVIPDSYGELNNQLGELREFVKGNFNSEEEKIAYYEKVIKEYEEG